MIAQLTYIFSIPVKTEFHYRSNEITEVFQTKFSQPNSGKRNENGAEA
jgi:hypothetical protein